MKQLVAIERFCLTGHILSLIFGLAGLLVVLPNPKLIAALPTVGQALFGWSMAGEGVVYILLGAVTVALYAYQRLGWRALLFFMLPAIGTALGVVPAVVLWWSIKPHATVHTAMQPVSSALARVPESSSSHLTADRVI